jgi:hypothetical protein
MKNVTTCSYTQSWVTTNGLSLYTPMDSGATQVAYYGGFGMPTVVLLGGSDHRVLFSTLSFATSDTSIMRDSILAVMNRMSTGISNEHDVVKNISIYPNPANDHIAVNLSLNSLAPITLSLIDMSGKKVFESSESNHNGKLQRDINCAALSNGAYLLRISCDGQQSERMIQVSH